MTRFNKQIKRNYESNKRRYPSVCGTSLPRFKQSPLAATGSQLSPKTPHTAHNEIRNLLSGWKLTMQIGSAQRGDIRANRATLLSTGLSEERSSDCPTDFR
ncbi:hypothetical protein CEXT_701101 [Caerostris extrusa]|uniref:Uncharacterized protein n=1 Tax=Caerostris extrusa TaxID=172846 RepID=A0AAV4NSZ1_CAEEX|nr:hypothetical protein CEXT_701101 [Caerostris extrusa]